MSGARTTAENEPSSMSTSSTNFEPPRWVQSLYPQEESHRLRGDDNWLRWSMTMQQIFETIEVWGVISGQEAKPPSNDSGLRDWIAKDRYVMTTIVQCVEQDIASELVGTSAKQMWDYLKSDYEQFDKVKTESPVHWFNNLFRKAKGTDPIDGHLQLFETSLRHLTNAGITLEDNVKVAFLLATLPDGTWSNFLSSIKITTTTTLSSIISMILEEVQTRNANDPSKTTESSIAVKKEVDTDKSNSLRENIYLADNTVNYSASCSDKKTTSSSSDSSLCDKTFHALHARMIIDSGSSTHIEPNKARFKTYSESTDSTINGIGDGKVKILGRGKSRINVVLPNGKSSKLELQNACHVPNMRIGLVSISKLDEADNYTLFGCGKAISFKVRDNGQLLRDITNNEEIVFTARKESDWLYYLDETRLPEQSFHISSTSKLETLHHRLGHLNYSYIRRMVKKNMIAGIKLNQEELNFEPPMCPSCSVGKITRAPHPPSMRKHANEFFGRVHSDLWGPAPVQTPNGSRYMITFTDDHTRFIWVYFLKLKSDVFKTFTDWKTQVEKQSGKTLKCFRTDNGTEYLGKVWTEHFAKHGIVHETTAPYTPEQNGTAERLNRTIMERVNTILVDARLPLSLWSEAAAYIAYTKNRNYTTTTGEFKTPLEMWTGTKPDISRLHRFGCVAYVLNENRSRTKLQPKGKAGIFVGYSTTQKAWRIYLPDTRKVQISNNVQFNDSLCWKDRLAAEGEYRYDLLKSASYPSPIPIPIPIKTTDDQLDHAPVDIDPPTTSRSQQSPIICDNHIPLPDPEPPQDPGPEEQQPQPRPSEALANVNPNNILPEGSTRRAKNLASVKIQTATRNLEKRSAAQYEQMPPLEQDPPEEDDEEQVNFELANIVSADIPLSYSQAMRSSLRSEWESAMEDEIQSVQFLGTYKLVPPPSDRAVIGTKWVYDTKRDLNGNISRFKARIVALGCKQKPGVDFFDTFAPVAKIDSIRLLCSHSASLDWEIHVVDVNSAFLNSELPEDQTVYVKQPEGFVVKGKEDHCWKLLKALYGLKQAGRLWYHKLRSILVQLGFKVSNSDPCIFYRFSSSSRSIISSHVDDLGLYCSTIAEVNHLKDQIREHVNIKDLGPISKLLGMEITRNRLRRTISLSHRVYIDKMLREYGFEDVKPVTTPIAAGTHLSLADCPKSPEERQAMYNIPYQNAVGALNHCAIMTRPDIAFAVQRVAQFARDPGMKHWEAVKRIFRYLKGTRDYTLTLGGQFTVPCISAFSDSDFANSLDHGRSISGYAITAGTEGCFAWSSKKQTATALSTGEAEYYSAVHAGRTICWLKQLADELQLEIKGPIPLNIDNTSSIQMIENSEEVTTRTKHVRLSYHWIRDVVAEGFISPRYIPTDNNISDIFTKGLTSERHWKLSNLLGIRKRGTYDGID